MPRSLTNAQLHCKCPRCREGDIFTYPLRKITKFGVMNTACPVCGILFEPEPGFYYGAMFVSYAFTVMIFTVISIFLYIFIHPQMMVYLISVMTATILLVPWSFRYSRVLWLYWFGGYRFLP